MWHAASPPTTSDDMNFKSPEGIVRLEELTGVIERLPPDQQPGAVFQRSVDTVGSHNMRYSFDMVKPSRWKVWVAVDAELRPLTDGDPQTIPKREALDAHLTTAVVGIVQHAFEDIPKHFAADIKEATHGDAGLTGRIPDKVDLEILVWDTVIPLEIDARTWGQSTYWVGKLGERRPWKDSWFPVIIPIPFFFDF